ncbi:unnamed protein product, partial [Dicrocoelium dendriticum]
AEDKTLINASLTNCSQAPCVSEGGTFATFEITFQSRRRVRSGKAKLCLIDSQSKRCLRELADTNDICDYIKQGCPLEQGGVYTYKKTIIAPDVPMEGETTHQLYDEECNVIACMQYRAEVRSKNKNIPPQIFTDDSYPCGGK